MGCTPLQWGEDVTNIKIVRVSKYNDGSEEVEGLVPARCAVGYYKVRIRVHDFKLLDSHCDCGEKICPHAIKLEMAYFRKKSSG